MRWPRGTGRDARERARLVTEPMTVVLGVDVGGSSVKGGLVDLATGLLTAEPVRIATPQQSTPRNVAHVVRQVVERLAPSGAGPVGVALPAVVTHGRTRSAANIDRSWMGCDAQTLFEDVLQRPILLANDADAAGVAEVHFGAARNHPGLVVVTTLGTGIGTAIVYRGVLVPNSELGHLEIDGIDAETRAASSVKDLEGLSYAAWAERLQTYYERLEALLWPDLIVLGGGVSQDSGEFLDLLRLNAEVVPAQLLNMAGIVGAAWLASAPESNPGLIADPQLSRPLDS